MISVVVPVYNSAGSLEELVGRLQSSLDAIGEEYELILVDDGSSDGSWEVLREIRGASSHMRIARSAVNRGQHNAILCGFSLVRGEIVVTLDDDLQHPPEEIPRLVAAVRDGNDLVVGAYDEKKHPRARNVAGAFIDHVQRRVFGFPSSFRLTSFRAIRRSVVNHALRMGGAYPFITAMLLANSSRRANVPVRHDARPLGSSNYSFLASLRLALNVLIGYSSYPLYFVATLCGLGFLFSSVLALATLSRVLLYGSSVPGWASTVAILTFFNSLTLLCLLIFGVYLSRISKQLTGTQTIFTIDEII